MNAFQIAIDGTLKPDGTLELNEIPNLAPGPVDVLIRKQIAPTGTSESWWEFLERGRAELLAYDGTSSLVHSCKLLIGWRINPCHPSESKVQDVLYLLRAWLLETIGDLSLIRAHRATRAKNRAVPASPALPHGDRGLPGAVRAGRLAAAPEPHH